MLICDQVIQVKLFLNIRLVKKRSQVSGQNESFTSLITFCIHLLLRFKVQFLSCPRQPNSCESGDEINVSMHEVSRRQ